jgi:hypothetical protein
VAQAQAAYYKQFHKLEIAELQNEVFAAQHLQTITLQVQQQHYSAKLCKLGEE